MEHSSDNSLSEPTMTSEAELIRLVQALTILPSQQREVLLRILSTAPSFDALQIDLATHPELQVALEHYSLDISETPKYQQSLEQLSPFAPASLNSSFQRAIEATVQYRWTNNEHALEEAISCWEYIFHHPDFPRSSLEFHYLALNNGGITFHLRYFAQGQVEDLSRGLAYFQQALEQTPLDSEKRAVPLCNLSIGLFTQYDLIGEVADLEQGILHLQEALSLTTLDSSSRPTCLINLGIGLSSRYSRIGQLADLEQAILLWHEALSLFAANSPDRPKCLMNLGNGLNVRYLRIGQLADLEQSIQLLYEALSLFAANSPDRPKCLMNLGIGLNVRYFHTKQLSDLEQAIGYYQETLSLVRPNSPTRLLCLENLGRVLLTRYDDTGSVVDLEQGIQFWYQALALVLPNSESRVKLLAFLCKGLHRLYNHTGNLADLEQCITLLRETLSLISPRSPHRASFLNTLGSVLAEQYELTNEQANLDQAFHYYNQALSLEPLGWGTRADILSNLGVILQTRYTLTGKLTDLEHAIQSLQQALDEVPIDGFIPAAYFTQLAIGLHSRYELTGHLADLDQAIHLYKQALTVTLLGSPSRTGYLTNFGNLWLSRYEYTGNLIDLKHALNTLHQAVEETPYESSERTLYLINLGEGLYIYYRHTGEKEDLERTCSIWSEAWFSLRFNFVTLPVSYKFGQQKRWFELYSNLISTHLLLASLDPSTAAISRQRAIEVAESSKSILLTQLIGRDKLSSPDGIPPEIIAREQVLLTNLKSLDNAELVAYGRPILLEKSVDRTRDLHNRQAYLQQLGQLWEAISKVGPLAAEYIAIRRGDAPTWADFKKLANKLGRNTALLSFFITYHRMRLFLVRKGWRGPHVVEISLPENKWADLLLRFSHEVPGSGGSSRRGETWDQPFQELLKQASKHLVGVNRLILTPQGAGHLLPWSVVFQRAGYHTSEGVPLPVVTLPSLGVLPRLRQRPRSFDGPPLIVGNPRGDLPFAEQEAHSVAAQFGVTPLLGSQATKAVVLAHLEHASLIHLATHAFFVPGAPLEAAIELADGDLTAQEVLQLRLQADLLVLSGCETGKAEALGGEELIGLAQAFLQAGVRSLLVSLWPVNDLASAALMMAFYQARQTGTDKAQALRQAMTKIQQDPRWHHPYYWGAFVLIGDWE